MKKEKADLQASIQPRESHGKKTWSLTTTMASSSSKKRKREAEDTSRRVSFGLADQPASQIGPVLGK